MDERNNISEYFYQQALQHPGAIERNASNYPYCSFSSFLMLYHFKKTKNPSFETAVQKNALLFHNTDWLLFQLHREPSELPLPVPANEAVNQEEKEAHAPSSILETAEETEPAARSVDAALSAPGNTAPEGIAAQAPFSQTLNEPPNEATIPEEEEGNQQFFQEGASEEEIPENPKMVLPSITQNDEEQEMTFEPLHTVDYFASIGVKIDEEMLKDDKLASQMKSFTEWLKSMKKIHPDKLQTQDAAFEKIVQASADESNVNTEILTEAMAEVLIKQNKKEKAIEMFDKLSLINPAKSAYFAAKIESIKSS